LILNVFNNKLINSLNQYDIKFYSRKKFDYFIKITLS
jgi:hypothetical protein